MSSGTVAAISSTFLAAAAVVEVAGPAVSVLFVQPDRASPPAMATIAVVRHQRPTFGRS